MAERSSVIVCHFSVLEVIANCLENTDGSYVVVVTHGLL